MDRLERGPPCSDSTELGSRHLGQRCKEKDLEPRASLWVHHLESKQVSRGLFPGQLTQLLASVYVCFAIKVIMLIIDYLATAEKSNNLPACPPSSQLLLSVG